MGLQDPQLSWSHDSFWKEIIYGELGESRAPMNRIGHCLAWCYADYADHAVEFEAGPDRMRPSPGRIYGVLLCGCYTALKMERPRWIG